MILYEEYQDSDYDILKSWWEKRGWAALPKEFLPKTGFVVKNGSPIIAGFLYREKSSPIGMIVWIISDPVSNKNDRANASEILIKRLIESASNDGVKYIFTLATENLTHRFEKMGFVKTDQNVTNMLYIIGGEE
mgnify:CR=1 FL=1